MNTLLLTALTSNTTVVLASSDGPSSFTQISPETWETDKFVFFWRPESIYSQGYPSRFTANGHEYCCAEQFMMAEKARLFGDEEVRQQQCLFFSIIIYSEFSV